MNVKLTAYSESLLRECLARGGYHTPEQVIERALEVLGEQEGQKMPGAARSPEVQTSLLQLQGLGKEVWRDMDAQAYVDQERAAWNG